MLNTLKTVLQKRGPKALNQLLNEEIIITEKLDTYRILLENVNGELKFFKKDNTELSLVERVLTNIWEDAIIEMSIILNDIELPDGLSFGIAYTPVNKPIRLNYEKLPKYILTDITKRDPVSRKVVESFDYDEVNAWAARLSLGSAPILFQGKLSEEQKQKLIQYGRGDFEGAEKLEEIIGKSYSGSDIIEGVIIKSGEQLFQIQTYEFQILNENYQRVESSRDFYDLTLLRINAFMDNYSYPQLREGASDVLYLELICDIFNNYCRNGNISEDIDPRYLNPPSYGYSGDLNLLLINNRDTIDILEKGNKIHESVFKIMLSSFRKYKRPFGLLSEDHTQKFNTFVYLINEKIGGSDLAKIPQTGLLNESRIDERSDNIVVNAVSDRIRTDVDNMKIIASLQKAFRPIAPKLVKGKEKCVVYLTNPQPFTNAHKENIENMARVWKVPVILGFVKWDMRMDGEKFHLSDDVRRAQIEAFADANSKLVPSFFAVDSWDLTEIFQNARPKYEPIAVITDKDKKSEFSLQLYFEEQVMGGRLGVEKDFNIGEMDVKDKLTAYRAIEDKLFYTFKELTPQPVWGFFDLMVSEYLEWNGSVPKQFQQNKF
jgi:hypothetical protein